MMKNLRNTGADEGSAMVAAVAVSIIGVALATLVVTQAISVARDTGRDAVRTAEVHAAEAALDATFLALESGNPCPGPTWSPLAVGTGADAVVVDVEIDYYDEDGDELACVGGEADGVAVTAFVTAEANAAVEQFGINPTRTFESRLILEPRETQDAGAAIFSASSFFSGAGLDLVPGAGGGPGDIWVDSGDYNCQTKVYIEGSLYVVDGKLTFSSQCQVTGDVWAQGDFEIQSIKNGEDTVGGNVTLENGDLISRQKEIVIGGDVVVGGSVIESGPKPGFLIGGTTTTGATVPDLTSAGLPYIDWDPTAWTSEGYVLRDIDDWTNHMVAEAKGNGDMKQSWQETQFRANPCTLEQSQIGRDPFDMPGVDTVYDLRSCQLSNNQSVEFTLWADTVFFVQGWDTRGPITVRSGDGDEHQFAVIVPQGDHPTTPSGFSWGEIRTHNGTFIEPPVEVFLYSPASIEFRNDSSTHGQVYANHVEVHSGGYFYYTPSDIPGVSLATRPTSDGSDVIIVYKREVK